MRCLSLATILHERGAQVIFICRDLDSNLNHLILNDFLLLVLPSACLDNHYPTLTGRDYYNSLLGVSQIDDASDTINALQESGIDYINWIIVDHYSIDHEWQKVVLDSLNGSNNTNITRLFVVDDLADRTHIADVLLDQNYFSDGGQLRYKNLVPSHCLQLLGPYYSLLRSSYSTLRSLACPRTHINRILVSFGGADLTNCTYKVLSALSSSTFSSYHVDVVVGPQNPHLSTISKFVFAKANFHLHHAPHNLAWLVSRADIAIGACGTSIWERSCLMLPSIVITTTVDQYEIALALHRDSYIILLGRDQDVSEEDIRIFLTDNLKTILSKYSSCELTDGYGSSRVASLLVSPSFYKCRKVNKSDLSLLFFWANESAVRNNSFSSEPISFSTHQSWFEKGFNDPNRLHYLFTDNYNIPCGQIRFDRMIDDLNKAILDYSLDKSMRGKGLSKTMLGQAIGLAKAHWSSLSCIIADVLCTNLASSNCLASLGFLQEKNASQKSFSRWSLDL